MAAQRGNSFNFLVVFVVALGSFTYGFSGTIIGSVLGLPSFWSFFGLTLGSSGDILGASTGCFYGGGFVGSLLSSRLSGKFGRRISLLIGCILGVLGGILQGAAMNIGMFLAGRAISGLCCGIFQTIVPIYQSEVSPAAQRGQMVGAHGSLVASGAAFSAWVGLGCYFSTNAEVQWRLCLTFTALSPLLLLLAIPFLPESPRWLIQKGRHEKAMEVLRKLHDRGGDGDMDHCREEFVQIEQQIEMEKNERNILLQVPSRASARRRLLIAVILPFLINSTGILVSATYQTIFYENLGITGWLSLVLLGVYLTWAAMLNFVNALLLDRVGRVRMLVIGMMGCALSYLGFTIMVALFANTTNRVGCGFGVFFIFSFITFYGGFLDVSGYVYWTEIFPTYARGTGTGVSIASFFATALVYNQVAPTAFATISWRFYLIFVIVPLLGIPVIYWMMPETKGKSLEDIAGLFGDTVAVTGEQSQMLAQKLAVGEDLEDKGTVSGSPLGGMNESG